MLQRPSAESAKTRGASASEPAALKVQLGAVGHLLRNVLNVDDGTLSCELDETIRFSVQDQIQKFRIDLRLCMRIIDVGNQERNQLSGVFLQQESSLNVFIIIEHSPGKKSEGSQQYLEQQFG